MELGATVCVAASPRCAACPVADLCAWRPAGYPAYDGPPRRGQTYDGTDRQCRGRLLGVLRDSHGPVHRTPAGRGLARRGAARAVPAVAGRRRAGRPGRPRTPTRCRSPRGAVPPQVRHPPADVPGDPGASSRPGPSRTEDGTVDSDLGIDELVVEFVVECREDLDGFEQDVVALEKDPGSRALLDAAFRTLHTVKGTSSYFGFDRLEAVTHLGESLLVGLRDGQVAFAPEVAAALLGVTDVVRALLVGIESDGAEPDLDTCGPGGPAAAVPDPAGTRRRTPARFGETLVAAGCGHPGDIAWAVAERPANSGRSARSCSRPGPGGRDPIESVLPCRAGAAGGLCARGRGRARTARRAGGALAWTRDEAVPLLPGETADRSTRSPARCGRPCCEPGWSPSSAPGPPCAPGPRPVRGLGQAGPAADRGPGYVDRPQAALAAVKDPMRTWCRQTPSTTASRPARAPRGREPAEATLTVRAGPRPARGGRRGAPTTAGASTWTASGGPPWTRPVTPRS